MGLKAYVLPLFVHHDSPTTLILKIGILEEDDLRLASKYRGNFDRIYKTTGIVSLRSPRHYLMNVTRRGLKRLFYKARNTMLNFFFGSFQRVLDVDTILITQPSLSNFFTQLTTATVWKSLKIFVLYAPAKE
jgi:hypothetical protein